MKKCAPILAALFYGLALYFCFAAQANASRTHYRLTLSLEATQAQEILEGEAQQEAPLAACFWGEVPSQSLTCRENGAAANVTYLPIQASLNILDKLGLAWEPGCLIDRSTAQALFGTDIAGGQTLYLGEQPYKVLGLLDSDRPAMVAVGREEDVSDRLILLTPPEAAQGEAFLIRGGITGREMDFYTPWTLARNALLLLPLALLLPLSWRGLHSLRREEPSIKPWLKLALGLLGCCTLLSLLVIPREVLPAKWSDFSFWGRMWQAQRENVSALLLQPMSPRHLRTVHFVIQSILSSTAAALAALWAVGRKDHAHTSD